MLIELKNLEVGDEIIVPMGSRFKYLKVLVAPALGKKLDWYTKLPLYKSVRCSTNLELVEKSGRYGSNNQIHKWTEKVFHCTGEGHNTTVSQNLNSKSLLLIKKGT